MSIRDPYVLFLGQAQDELDAKTAVGIAHWRPSKCVGQIRLDGARVDLGLPDMTVGEAAQAGARTLVVGVANRGGVLAESWLDVLESGLVHGLDLASGLHTRLRDNERLARAAQRYGGQLHDVRHPTRTFPVGSGEKRPGKRVLAVGTDASVGKMYTTLALEHGLTQAGLKASFRATGQTGILVAGTGVAVDAVVADFIAGAAEWLSPANEADHWDVVEGQGSLAHPSFAGVSLGLLHGSQPDALVVCHEPTRTSMRGLPGRSLPTIAETIRINEDMARLTNPNVRTVGLCVNTAGMDAQRGDDYLKELADTHGLPACDPVRHGADAVVAQLAKL